MFLFCRKWTPELSKNAISSITILTLFLSKNTAIECAFIHSFVRSLTFNSISHLFIYSFIYLQINLVIEPAGICPFVLLAHYINYYQWPHKDHSLLTLVGFHISIDTYWLMLKQGRENTSTMEMGYFCL